MNLRELHEAATPAPWEACSDDGYDFIRSEDGSMPAHWFSNESVCGCGEYPAKDTELIVALRNAYADGTLVERGELDEALAMCEWLVSEDASDLSYDLVVIWTSWWTLPNQDDPEWAWLKDEVERKRVFHEWLDPQMLQAAREAVRDGQ